MESREGARRRATEFLRGREKRSSVSRLIIGRSASETIRRDDKLGIRELVRGTRDRSLQFLRLTKFSETFPLFFNANFCDAVTGNDGMLLENVLVSSVFESNIYDYND